MNVGSKHFLNFHNNKLAKLVVDFASKFGTSNYGTCIKNSYKLLNNKTT